MEVQEWRWIPDFEGQYRISSNGAVFSVGRYFKHPKSGETVRKPRLVSQSTTADGYCKVTLIDVPGKMCYFLTHRLMLMAFVGPCPAGYESRHLDGDRSNADLSNLAWGTPCENEQDKKKHGTYQRGNGKNMAKLTEEEVLTIRAQHESGESKKHLSLKYNVSVTCVERVINRQSWIHI